MRYLKGGIRSILFLALLALGIPVLAQQSASEQKPATASDTSGPWQPVGDGIWKASISRFQEQAPEFAVLRLSAGRYKEFKKNPKDFLNDQKTFGKPVKKVVSFRESAPQTQAPTDAYWYVIVSHWPPSSAACVAYSEWGAPASSDTHAPASKPPTVK